MASYTSLLFIEITHAFFDSSPCRDIRIVPSQETQKMFDEHGMILKRYEASFRILIDMESKVAREDLDLQFFIFCDDPYFSVYTQLPTAPQSLLRYTTTAIDTNGQAIPQDPITLDNSRQSLFAQKSTIKKPFMLINAPLSIEQQKTISQEQKITIQLASKSVHWKYYFIGELANHELEIHDLAAPSSVQFDRCDEPIPQNGQAFISQTPIMMNNLPKQRFQLKDKNQSGKVLVKRLPNAGIQLISRGRNLTGQQIFVAEIYINQ